MVKDMRQFMLNIARVRVARPVLLALRASLALIFVALVLCAPTALSLPAGEVMLPVRQVFTNYSKTPGIDETFAYRLTPESDSCPLPAGADATGYTFTMTGNDQIELGPMHFSRAGTYDYDLRSAKEERSGYSADPQVYRIRFLISNSRDALCVAYLEDGNKAPMVSLDPSFRASAAPGGDGQSDDTTATPAPAHVLPGTNARVSHQNPLPKTGEAKNQALIAVMSAATLGVLTLLISSGRRRKESPRSSR